MKKIFFLLLLIFGSLGFAAANTESVIAESKTTKSAQQVIRAQLEAFANDDAKRAFSFATPGIQKIFGNPEKFMQMVRSNYAVVYRPSSVVFLLPEFSGDSITQPVFMTDAQGKEWIAVYRLEYLKLKSWRIAGCEVAPKEVQIKFDSLKSI